MTGETEPLQVGSRPSNPGSPSSAPGRGGEGRGGREGRYTVISLPIRVVHVIYDMGGRRYMYYRM